MNEVPYVISAIIRVYSNDDETWEVYRRQKRIVMASNEQDAKNKYKIYMEKQYFPANKIKCYNMEIEEPIV